MNLGLGIEIRNKTQELRSWLLRMVALTYVFDPLAVGSNHDW